MEKILLHKALEDIEVQKTELTDKLANAKNLAEVSQLESDINQITKIKIDLDKDINPESLKNLEHIKDTMQKVIEYIVDKLNQYISLKKYLSIDQKLIESHIIKIKQHLYGLKQDILNETNLSTITNNQTHLEEYLSNQVFKLEENLAEQRQLNLQYHLAKKK